MAIERTVMQNHIQNIWKMHVLYLLKHFQQQKFVEMHSRVITRIQFICLFTAVYFTSLPLATGI